MVRVLLLLVIVVAGCRSSTKSGGPGRDPLYGRYIPKQDLPIPEKRDPLLSAPVSNPKGVSRSEPFRNSKATSVAGLASRVPVENSGLSLDDRRTPAEGVPLRRGPASESWSDVAEELTRLRARYDAPVNLNGEYVMSATVPVGNALRRYEASGTTPAAAARDLLKQIQNP